LPAHPGGRSWCSRGARLSHPPALRLGSALGGGWAGIPPELRQRPPTFFGSGRRCKVSAALTAKECFQRSVAPMPAQLGRRCGARGAWLSHPPALRVGAALWGRVGGDVSGARKWRPKCFGAKRCSNNRATPAADALPKRVIAAGSRAPRRPVGRSRETPAHPPLFGARAPWPVVVLPRGKALPPARPAGWCRSLGAGGWGGLGGRWVAPSLAGAGRLSYWAPETAWRPG
jgi:hypothetical protein